MNNLVFVFCFKLHFMSHAHCCIFQARGEIPRLPNGLPEKSSRPDRPRARDRPKPRRRPRPKETTAGETRRSRSAPAQSSPPVPLPPTHTAQHEGFLFRKIDIDGQKKSSNRWGFLEMMGTWHGISMEMAKSNMPISMIGYSKLC